MFSSEKLTNQRSKSLGKIRLTLNLSTVKGRYEKCVHLFKFTIFAKSLESAARSCQNVSMSARCTKYSLHFRLRLPLQKWSNSSYITARNNTCNCNIHKPVRTLAWLLLVHTTYSTTLLVSQFPRTRSSGFFFIAIASVVDSSG